MYENELTKGEGKSCKHSLALARHLFEYKEYFTRLKGFCFLVLPSIVFVEDCRHLFRLQGCVYFTKLREPAPFHL